jgi:hypothetical protein
MPSSKPGAGTSLHPYDSDPEIAVVPLHDDPTTSAADENMRRMSVTAQYPPPPHNSNHNAPETDPDSVSMPSRSRGSRFWDRLPWWMRIGSVWQTVGGVPGGGVVGWGAVNGGEGGRVVVGHMGHHVGDLHVDIDCCDESDHEEGDDAIGANLVGAGSEEQKQGGSRKKGRGGLRVSKLGRYDYWL